MNSSNIGNYKRRMRNTLRRKVGCFLFQIISYMDKLSNKVYNTVDRVLYSVIYCLLTEGINFENNNK